MGLASAPWHLPQPGRESRGHLRAGCNLSPRSPWGTGLHFFLLLHLYPHALASSTLSSFLLNLPHA